MKEKVRVERGVLNNNDIVQLREFLYQQEPGVKKHQQDSIVKKPQWDQTNWPQHIIQRAVEQLIGLDYRVQEVDFFETRASGTLHADSHADADRLGPAILFCIHYQPQAQTVFFDNYWPHGEAVCFTHEPWNPWRHRVYLSGDQWVDIQDIRDLLDTCRNSPEQAPLTVTTDFVASLEALIEKRSLSCLPEHQRPANYNMPLRRVSDYSQIENYQSNKTFDRNLLSRYIRHQDPTDFDGLVLDQVVEWSPGTAMVFHRSQLHISSSMHKVKSGLSVWTVKK